MTDYDQNNINLLLNHGFTLEELRDFIFFETEFRPVHEQFPQNSGNKRQIIRAIIEHAERRDLFETLLKWAAHVNVNTYEKYLPYIKTAGSKAVHFVTVAMTRSEAEALASGQLFGEAAVGAGAAEAFQKFKSLLLDCGIDDLASYYGAERDEWRPPFHQNHTLQETIIDIVERVNQDAPLDMPQIQPHFISTEFFSPDRETRQHTWQATDTSCIIVIDSISLFHPWVYEILQQSEMSSRDEVALLALSPVNFSQLPINQLIEKRIMDRALDRFQELKGLSEFGAGDLRVLRRWLFETLPDVVAHKRQAKPENRSLLRKHLGRTPRGLAPLNW